MVVSSGTPEALRECCEGALQNANLKPDGLKKTFLVPFENAVKTT
jgi:hypothetical protein